MPVDIVLPTPALHLCSLDDFCFEEEEIVQPCAEALYMNQLDGINAHMEQFNASFGLLTFKSAINLFSRSIKCMFVYF